MLPLPPTAQRQALRSIGSSKWALGVNEILDGVCVPCGELADLFWVYSLP